MVYVVCHSLQSSRCVQNLSLTCAGKEASVLYANRHEKFDKVRRHLHYINGDPNFEGPCAYSNTAAVASGAGGNANPNRLLFCNVFFGPRLLPDLAKPPQPQKAREHLRDYQFKAGTILHELQHILSREHDRR